MLVLVFHSSLHQNSLVNAGLSPNSTTELALSMDVVCTEVRTFGSGGDVDCKVASV